MAPDTRTSLVRTTLGTGLALIVLGAAAAVLGSATFDGFVKGMFQGAGVTMLLLGVYLVSRTRTRGRGRAAGTDDWLPSRDGGR